MANESFALTELPLSRKEPIHLATGLSTSSHCTPSSPHRHGPGLPSAASVTLGLQLL